MLTWPLGLACVAAATQKAGHEVKLLDLMEANDPNATLAEAIHEFNPDVIGISVRNIDDQSMENTQFLLDDVREAVAVCRSLSKAPIVLGGAGYSIFPESSLEYLGADMGIQGEGEKSFIELTEADRRGPGLFRRARPLRFHGGTTRRESVCQGARRVSSS